MTHKSRNIYILSAILFGSYAYLLMSQPERAIAPPPDPDTHTVTKVDAIVTCKQHLKASLKFPSTLHYLNRDAKKLGVGYMVHITYEAKNDLGMLVPSHFNCRVDDKNNILAAGKATR